MVRKNTELEEPDVPSNELVEALAELDPKGVPSGPFNLRLEHGDHVLLLVYSDTDYYFSKLLEFLQTGIEDPITKELVSISVPENRSAEEVAEHICSDLQAENGRIETADWGETIAELSPDKEFTREEEYEMIRNRMKRLKESGLDMVRLVSDDTTDYLNWVNNPKEWLDWEYYISNDYKYLGEGLPFLIMCTYHVNGLDGAGENLSQDRVILELLSAHDKTIVVTEDDELLYPPRSDHYAINKMDLKSIPLNYKIKRYLLRLLHRPLGFNLPWNKSVGKS